jgi:hypothetical protein
MRSPHQSTTRAPSEHPIRVPPHPHTFHTPQELILNGNAVGDVGARYLMNALKNNNSGSPLHA